MSSKIPAIDLVIVIDTSPSMRDEAQSLSEIAETVIQTVTSSCPSDVRVTWFGIEGTWKGTNFNQTIRDYLTRECQVSESDLRGRQRGELESAGAQEDGARAIEDITNYFDWRDNADKAIFFLGDEALEGGGGKTEQADIEAANRAIAKAVAAGVTVHTYFGTSKSKHRESTAKEFARVATETGGLAFTNQDAIAGFAPILEAVICNSRTFKTLGVNLTPGTVYVQDYQSHQLSSLYTLDLVTGNARLIGAIATSVADLAFIDSQLYGLDQTDDGQTTLLLNINPTTGEATVIGDVGFAVTGLAYHRQRQTLYATSAKQLIAINPATGTGTPVVTIKDRERNCGEVTFAADGTAYITLIGYDRQKLLATCDLDTGEINTIGNIGFPDLTSMEFIGDVLYGVTGNFFNLGKDGQLIRIDPTTGAGTLVTITDPMARWAGITVYQPVTESTTQPTTPTNSLTKEESMTLLTIDTKDNCYVIDQGAMEHLQSNVANSISLDQGTYTLKIGSGRYSYADDKGGGEPFVLLWIYGIDGSTFINKNTDVEIGATWTTLNGYDDPLSLEVKDKAVVCALFFDINQTDNSGSVTLSITKNQLNTPPQTLTVDSKNNCYLLDTEYLSNLKQWQKNYIDLEPGTYQIKIREGNAKYWSGEQKFKLEPWAIIQVKGGKFVTELTGVQVEESWLSLNGYQDFIALEVEEKTTVCGLFLDTYKEDNQGQIILAIEPVSLTHLVEEKEKIKEKVASDSDSSPQTPSEESANKTDTKVHDYYRPERPVSVNLGNLATLSFDSFGRDPARDIVCVTPVRTVVRREQEITIIRKIRKVEEIDASPACPVNTTQVSQVQQGGELTVKADYFVHPSDAPGDLPRITNDKGRKIRVEVTAFGQWNYGKEEGISESVTGKGNLNLQNKEDAENDMLFQGIAPAALVAFTIKGNEYQCKAYGDKQTFELNPGETVYFINNDQPGFYQDNSASLTVKWMWSFF